jgi:esterase/lipase
MHNFKFLKVSSNIKIRILKNKYKNLPFVVFLHGFKSDLEGEKPKALLKYCNSKKMGFLALEYSGHGKSSGKFINGNITKWSSQTSYVIKKILKKNNFILVGSSMGSWISMKQFRIFKNQIIGFLGIGSAPEFLELLMWRKFSKKIKKEIIKNKIYNLKHGSYEYPITYQLIKDGRDNRVLNKKINYFKNVTMVHGSKDEVVPVSFSRKILKIFSKSKKKLLIIKNGDHSLSSKKNLKKIIRELDFIVSTQF